MTRELIIIELPTEDDFKTSWLEFFYFASIAPYFILGSVVDDGVGQDSAERGRGALLVAIYRKPGIHVPAHDIPASVICHNSPYATIIMCHFVL